MVMIAALLIGLRRRPALTRVTTTCVRVSALSAAFVAGAIASDHWSDPALIPASRATRVDRPGTTTE